VLKPGLDVETRAAGDYREYSIASACARLLWRRRRLGAADDIANLSQLCGYTFAVKHLDKRQVIISSAKGAVTQVRCRERRRTGGGLVTSEREGGLGFRV
jgi:hypothetical protein